MRVLLVEPAYYTRYPPLGLLKLASFHKACGDDVVFHRGLRGGVSPRPKLILVSSLFTYSWRPVHEAVRYCRSLYPRAEIRVGGIYATLMPEHAELAGADEVRRGLTFEVEQLRPDYSLVPEWDSSIVFATRGCIRKCAFCAVPRLEGKTRGPARSVGDVVDPRHRKVVLWDNNILGVPNWRQIVEELRELDVEADFNQGLDARLITDEVAESLGRARIRPVRMAYDTANERKALERAIPALEAGGFKRRRMIVYTLYNFRDSPEDFLSRVVDLLSWGVVCYPMRYEPLNSLIKNRYVSPYWTATQLEMVARARRVIGAGGAFPPYQALLEKFREASSFEEAFGLRRREQERRYPQAAAGVVEKGSGGLGGRSAAFRELLNDPSSLEHEVSCEGCGGRMQVGERAFAVQDYEGKYVGYICPSCHPHRKWINGLWRSVLGEKFSKDGHESPSALPVGVTSRAVH